MKTIENPQIKFKVGSQIMANINGQPLIGTVSGLGVHKGRPVADMDDICRFVYLSQIISVIRY